MYGHGISLSLLLAIAVMTHGQIAYAPNVPVNIICGHCCQQGSFCEATLQTITLSKAAGGLHPGHTFQAGTDMTCYLRDRDQGSAVDGGLCIPSAGIPDITSFCADFADSSSSRVVPTIYQAGLQEQQHVCKPCCDGKFVCSYGLKCASVEGSGKAGGICVPEAEDDIGICQGTTLTKKILSCERCDAYSPLARALLSGKMQKLGSRRHLAEPLGLGGVTGSSATQATTPVATALPPPALSTPSAIPASPPPPGNGTNSSVPPPPGIPYSISNANVRSISTTQQLNFQPPPIQTPMQGASSPMTQNPQQGSNWPPAQGHQRPNQTQVPPAMSLPPPTQSNLRPVNNNFPPLSSGGTPPSPGGRGSPLETTWNGSPPSPNAPAPYFG